MNTIYDVVVIGGGPAGMMAAVTAAERGKRVLLLEKNAVLGKKLAITGGGRCNVTNNTPDVRTMLSAYKESGKFLFSTFMQHGVQESKSWFSDHGVALIEEEERRMFPSTERAETIRDTLVASMSDLGVTVRLRANVTSIERRTRDSMLLITQGSGETVTTPSCVVAVGGTSHPETGSTGDGFVWMTKLGHRVAEDKRSLVPLLVKEPWVHQASGVALPLVKMHVCVDDKRRLSPSGKLLFTHVGVSGPVVLQASKQIGDLLREGVVTLRLNLFPQLDTAALKREVQRALVTHSNRQLRNILPELLPPALVTPLLSVLALDGMTPGHSVTTEDRKRIVTLLGSVPLTVTGLMGRDKAVIAGGGVELTEIDFRTMESRLVPGLFIVGDMLNIDRPSGGYSLQLCWSTGYVAGMHA